MDSTITLNQPSGVKTNANVGMVGMTICLGKHQANALPGHFRSDVALVLNLIEA